MKKRRPSIIAVIENGMTRYGITNNYGGLASIALRLVENAQDERGKDVPYFERLMPINEVKEIVFRDYEGRPADADDLVSFAEIDVDQNMIRIDDDMLEEREYHEYPLDLLLKKTAQLKAVRPDSRYINKQHLYNAMDAAVRSAAQKKETGSKKQFQTMLARLYPEENMSDNVEIKGMELG